MDDPGDRLQCRALADAVAAQEPHDLAAPDIQRNTVQDVALAVMRVDFLNLQERVRRAAVRGHVFRYTSRTRGFCWISAGVPSASTRPECSTVMRFASPMTTSMSCSTIRIVRCSAM